jgi:hypothetical protein
METSGMKEFLIVAVGFLVLCLLIVLPLEYALTGEIWLGG